MAARWSRAPTCLAVVEERDEEVGREDGQELPEGARALREVHLEDALIGELACVGPRAAPHQVPQVYLRPASRRWESCCRLAAARTNFTRRNASESLYRGMVACPLGVAEGPIQ